jgi:uncharacterized protein with HEPN domain
MKHRDLSRFQHMLESCEAISAYIRGKQRFHLDEERLLASAIVRELEIIGEAAVAISQETKDRFPHFPWKQVIAMRNRLIHAYFDINYDIIWATIQESVPSLQKQLREIILIFEK